MEYYLTQTFTGGLNEVLDEPFPTLFSAARFTVEGHGDGSGFWVVKCHYLISPNAAPVDCTLELHTKCVEEFLELNLKEPPQLIYGEFMDNYIYNDYYGEWFERD
jgi:hypothetical protein